MAFHITCNFRCYTTSQTSSCPTAQAYCSDTLRNCLWLQHNLLVMSLWLLLTRLFCFLCFLSDLVDEESSCNRGDWGLIPGSGRSPGEGNGNPLQYSCLENCMDRGAWWATLHGITKSWTWPYNFFVLFSYRKNFDYLLMYHSVRFLKQSKQC